MQTLYQQKEPVSIAILVFKYIDSRVVRVSQKLGILHSKKSFKFFLALRIKNYIDFFLQYIHSIHPHYVYIFGLSQTAKKVFKDANH